MGAAVEQYNLANVRLQKIESDQRENRRQLKLTRANLKVAQALARGAARHRLHAHRRTTRRLSVLLGATSLEDLLNRIEAVNSTSQQDASIVQQVTSFKAAIQRHRAELRKAHSEQQSIVAQKAAQKQRIESQLASRRQLLSSIKGQIARIKAAEAAQQRQLAASARARLAGEPRFPRRGVGVSASTPEGSDRRTSERPRRRRRDRDALPRRAVRLGRVDAAWLRLLRARVVCLRADRRLAAAQLVRAVHDGDGGFDQPVAARRPRLLHGREPHGDLHRRRPVHPRAAHRRRREDLVADGYYSSNFAGARRI